MLRSTTGDTQRCAAPRKLDLHHGASHSRQLTRVRQVLGPLRSEIFPLHASCVEGQRNLKRRNFEERFSPLPRGMLRPSRSTPSSPSTSCPTFVPERNSPTAAGARVRPRPQRLQVSASPCRERGVVTLKNLNVPRGPVGDTDTDTTLDEMAALSCTTSSACTTVSETSHPEQCQAMVVSVTKSVVQLGLGCIQLAGRSPVLQSWSAGPRCGVPTKLTSRSPCAKDWNTAMPDAQRDALHQWVSGHLGSQHCTLILENGKLECVASELELEMEDLCNGTALNMLCGMHAEVELLRADQSGLFHAVFSKTPAQVLDDALRAAVEEMGEGSPYELSATQAHLALRRRAMKDLGFLRRGACTLRRTQVWLELLRIYYEGLWGKAPKVKERPEKTTWDDRAFLRDLGKARADLEAESFRMDIEVLRQQNGRIEEYVHRLVRQRQDLKHATKLMEQRDSYHILRVETHSTDQEVRKAYRALARKEHPDKAGIDNKGRFQVIHQAYMSVLRQRELEGSDGRCPGNLKALTEMSLEAACCADAARTAADLVGLCCHRVLGVTEKSPRLQCMPPKKMLAELKILMHRTEVDLLKAVQQSQVLSDSVRGVASCVMDATAWNDNHAATTASGTTLSDRVQALQDRRARFPVRELEQAMAALKELFTRVHASAQVSASKSVESPQPASAPSTPSRGRRSLGGELLSARGTERRVVERSQPRERASMGGRRPGEATTSVAGNTAMVIRACFLLLESLTLASAALCKCADEAITTAVEATELSRTLMYLTREVQKEKRKGARDDDQPMPAPDVSSPEEDETAQSDCAPPTIGDAARPPSSAEVLKSLERRVKERHVELRVKNIVCLTRVNDDVLKLQSRLCELLGRTRGILLPQVSVEQKKWVFDLIVQILESALAECNRFADTALPPSRIMEQCFSFVLSLQHAREIAIPVDSRTQALKLAALIDVDFLCQIIDGPFKRRLRQIKRRCDPVANFAFGGRRSVREAATPAAKAWEEAVFSGCARVVQGLRLSLPDGCARTAV